MDRSEYSEQRHHTPETDREQNIKIFVTGVEFKTPIAEIFALFSKYGPISNVREILKKVDHKPLKRMSKKNDVCSGSCCVETPCSSTAEKILSIGTFNLNNRDIMCAPFKLGRELASENEEKNRRRVLLKKVPAHIPENQLRSAVELMFGPVEVFFAFLSDDKRGKKKGYKGKHLRSIRTYSVMFRNVESCNLAIEAGEVFLADDAIIIIERFSNEFRREKLCKAYQKSQIYENHGEAWVRVNSKETTKEVEVPPKAESFDDLCLLDLATNPKSYSCPVGNTIPSQHTPEHSIKESADTNTPPSDELIQDLDLLNINKIPASHGSNYNSGSAHLQPRPTPSQAKQFSIARDMKKHKPTSSAKPVSMEEI